MTNLLEKNCNRKTFVDFATTRSYRGLSTIEIKHKFFRQSKLGRDVELHITHIVLFKSPHYVIQVSRVSGQLGLGSELVDWYREATLVPYGLLFTEMWPRTDDRVRFGTNNRSVSTKFFIPDWLKHFNSLEEEHIKFLYSPSVPIIFPQVQKSFP